MRIFVLGAGRMGSIAAMDLAKRSQAEIAVGDIDRERAESVAKVSGGIPHKIDVNNSEELAKVFKGYDAVLNAAWYEFNLHVMKACITAGCCYNDLGGLFHMTLRQLELNDQAKKAGISAIVGGGESPGITNVMAFLCASRLDVVDSIKIYAGAKEKPQQKTYEELIFPFSVATVIDEYSKKPIEFLGGKYVELDPLSGSEELEFPEPVGKNVVHYSIHSEPATLPRTVGKGIKNVEFKLGISEVMIRTLKPLIEMGLISENKIRVNGVEITPKDFLVNFFNATKPSNNESERSVSLKALAIGTRRGRKCVAEAGLVCGPDNELNIRNATAYLTGSAGSIFAQLLANGSVREKGVLASESAVDTHQFFEEFEKRGIRLNNSITEFN